VTWPAILALAVGCYTFKAIGPFTQGRFVPSERTARLLGLFPAALFAALISIDVFGDGRALNIDERVAGIAAAGIAVWLKAPMVVVMIAGAATTALLRVLV
jgi:branched-subunit amino acid transport protein